jgi:hypothetical protein
MTGLLQRCLAFHRTGRLAGSGLEGIDASELRPALFARYRDLTSLRYDFPVILVDRAPESEALQSLSGVVDDLIRTLGSANGDDGMANVLFRQEHQIRSLVLEGADGLLSDLWRRAATLVAAGDARLTALLDTARAALPIDGRVVDCDENLAARVLAQAWHAIHHRRSAEFCDKLRRLTVQLSDILESDFTRSLAGLTAARLRASVGTIHAGDFDFDMLSRVLTTGRTPAPLPTTRRERIHALISTLGSQRFYVSPVLPAARDPHTFIFESCETALWAYRARLSEMRGLARAIAIAELEIEGVYDEDIHESVFAAWEDGEIGRSDWNGFPTYLVEMHARDMSPIEHDALLAIFAAQLPIKVLVQTDDVLDDAWTGDGVAMRSRQLGTMAMGLGDVFVVQSSASHLFQVRDALCDGLRYAGPTLFSIFSGAGDTTGDLPPYLVAAAAMESRVFPSFVYDPTKGADWATRVDIRSNPQAAAVWPRHQLDYEDARYRRMTEPVAFTAVDFMACDHRFAGHLAGVRDTSGLQPVSELLGAVSSAATAPYVLMVDREDRLRPVVVDDRLVQEARRCQTVWHNLQELGGVLHPPVERPRVQESPAVVHAVPPGPVAPPPPAQTAAEKRSPDDPYIETARCSTCNECTQVNPRMFAYNADRQAYIVDPSLGTYRDLVEAAERCQVSVIHPGKPRNTNEPGLDELIARAEPFN